MPSQSARARRIVTRTRPQQHTTEACDRAIPSVPPGGKYTGVCPVCDGVDKLKVAPRTDVPNRWSVHCRSAECDAPGGEWLREVAEHTGFTQTELLDDPLHCLSDYLDSECRDDLPPAQLPSVEGMANRQTRLWENDSALAYLKDERKLTAQTIRRAGVGWESDPSAFTFPIYDAQGQLVNVVRRPLPHVAGPKYIAMRGRDQRNDGVQLYPQPLPRGSWLLVEGLFDALLGRQVEFPAVSPTHGVSTFLDEWLPLVKGRRVAVMYDVGAEQVTRHRVEQLNAAGAEAWAVDLSELLTDGKDLTDYMRQRGVPQLLADHIRRERRRSRGA